VIVFLADHGESLGEHDYWGHGRHLYEPTLRIPFAISWPGRIEPGRVQGPALITDVGATLLGLLGFVPPEGSDGYDWSAVLSGTAPTPVERITRYQAHRGAVMSRHRSDLARRSGLLEVGLIDGSSKEIFQVSKQRSLLFDLDRDPGENSPGPTRPNDTPSEALHVWMKHVYAGLTNVDDGNAPEPLDEESEAALRSLGYVD
jgi:arylsulfatase A-like enzyme